MSPMKLAIEIAKLHTKLKNSLLVTGFWLMAGLLSCALTVIYADAKVRITIDIDRELYSWLSAS